MLPVKILFRICKTIVVILAPLIIVLSSILLTLPNASVHKNSLKNSDFYNKLSQELKNTNSDFDLKNGFLNILVLSSIKDLASPGWLQNLAEKNIDLTSKWLGGENSDWTFYLPTQDLNNSVQKNIDQQTKEISTKNTIPVCSKAVSEGIKREGFDLNKELCLPEEVSKGQTTLTDYLGFKDSPKKQQDALSTIVKNNSIDSQTESFKVKDNALETNLDTVRIVNKLRDNFLYIRSFVPFLLSGLLALTLITLVLARLAGKKLLKEIRGLLWVIATSTFVTVICVLCFFGVSSYLTSSLNNLLLPGIASSQVINLVLLQFIRFIFDLLYIALVIIGAMIGINLVTLLIEKILNSRHVEKKNTRLQGWSGDPKQTQTLDGHFKKEPRDIYPGSPVTSQDESLISAPVENSFEVEQAPFENRNIGNNNQNNTNPEKPKTASIFGDELNKKIYMDDKPKNKWF